MTREERIEQAKAEIMREVLDFADGHLVGRPLDEQELDAAAAYLEERLPVVIEISFSVA